MKRGGGKHISISKGGHEHKKRLTNTDLRQGERVRMDAERLWSEVILPIADGTQNVQRGQVEAV
jgi:hypothetical protein